MAYGDNRNELATDTFDSIGASWGNGYADFGTCAAAAGNCQPSLGFTTSGMRREAADFTADQYSTCTVGAGGSSMTHYVAVRMHPTSTTDESCYCGGFNDYGSDTYAIEEISSAFGFTTLTSGSWGGAPAGSGDTITIEAEGTTLRMGTSEGGADTQRLTTTDATLAGSTYTSVGLLFYVDSSTVTGTRFSDWAGGSIGAGGGGATLSIAPIMQNYRNMGLLH